MPQRQKKGHFWHWFSNYERHLSPLNCFCKVTTLALKCFLQNSMWSNCLKDRKCHFWHWFSNHEWHLSPLNWLCKVTKAFLKVASKREKDQFWHWFSNYGRHLSPLNCFCKVTTLYLKCLLENSMWNKIASKTENATFGTDFQLWARVCDISHLWIVFAKQPL